jgi:hypothetical protein
MKRNLILLLLLVVSALVLPVFQAGAASLAWSGGSLVPTNLWSDANNWDTLTAPVDGDAVAFNNTGSTNLPGIVNTVANTNLTLASLDYKAQVSFVSLITNYHTLLLNPGVTLTIDNGANPGNLLNVGDVDSGAIDAQYYSTILGTNASLVAGNTNSPVPNQGLQVTATAMTLVNHIGSLDLSGLDNFTFAGGYVWVGASSANAIGATDRPVGKMALARTNFIVANSPSADGAFRLGDCKGNTPPRESQLELGQDNTIYTVWMKVGGLKDGAAAGGHVFFRASLTNNNPILRLRGGTGGSSRVNTLSVGDNLLAGNSSIGTKGVMDLGGGTFDALVDVAYVGRSSSGATTGTGAAAGTVTWDAGTFDVTTLNIGYQAGNATNNATGTINVRGANASLIAGSIIMGRDAGSVIGKGTGTLNITSGTATVFGTITEGNGSGGNGTSTINITAGVLNAGGVVTVDNINLTSGTISNAALITVSSLKGTGTILGPVTVLTNLGPGLPVGTLIISNNLVLSATCTNVFEVNLDTFAADKVAGVSNVTFGGTLVLTNVGGVTAATNGATFKLFDAATYSGSFAATNLPALGGGFVWDLSSLGTNGSVKLVATVNTAPTNMIFQLTGGALDLSWPTDHTGWRLEGQTNTLNIGLTTNWFTVAGSAATNRIVLTINPTNGSSFFRLVYP